MPVAPLAVNNVPAVGRVNRRRQRRNGQSVRCAGRWRHRNLTADLPAYFAGLGLPGAINIRVSFVLNPVLQKVSACSTWSLPPTMPWPIRYRFDEQTRLDVLRGFGVICAPRLSIRTKQAWRPG